MSVFDETLDRISHGGEAVFAIDGADRIILWNKACATLVGIPARRVLGKPCYDVMCGRDGNGNLYCNRSCPVAYQARQRSNEPVHRFELTVKAVDGEPKRVSTSLFAIPSYHPALTTVVHVLRAAEESPARAPASAPVPCAEPLIPLTNDEGESVALTSREKEVLRCLADGMTTRAVAQKLLIAAVTVRNHIQNILGKLDVHSKLEAVVLAHKQALI